MWQRSLTTKWHFVCRKFCNFILHIVYNLVNPLGYLYLSQFWKLTRSTMNLFDLFVRYFFCVYFTRIAIVFPKWYVQDCSLRWMWMPHKREMQHTKMSASERRPFQEPSEVIGRVYFVQYFRSSAFVFLSISLDRDPLSQILFWSCPNWTTLYTLEYIWVVAK